MEKGAVGGNVKVGNEILYLPNGKVLNIPQHKFTQGFWVNQLYNRGTGCYWCL